MTKKQNNLKKATEWNSDWAEYPWTSVICPHCDEHLMYEWENGKKGNILLCHECKEKFELGITDYELGCPVDLKAKEFIQLLPKKSQQILLDMFKEAQADVDDCNGITEAEDIYKIAIKLIEKVMKSIK